MKTLKKLWMYFLLFIVFFIIITVLTNLAMRQKYEDITNCEILSTSPIITVNESKSANTNGYIKGSVTNDTGKLIPIKYLKINLYDKDEVYLGSEYKELKNFYPKETINYEISYNYNNVDKIELGLSDEITKNKTFNFFSDIEDNQLKIAIPIAGLLVVSTLLP